jgi:uncharacterized protein YxjI
MKKNLNIGNQLMKSDLTDMQSSLGKNMLQRLFFCILFAAIYMGCFQAPLQGDILYVPQKFSVKQRWFSFTNTFDIENPDGKMGTLHRRFFSLLLEYDYYDNQDQFQAKAKMRFFSIGATFDVTDKDGTLIGTAEQRIFNFFPTFEIFSAERHSLAIAKMNFWGTKYTLYDPCTNAIFIEMKRPFFRLRDSWNVTIIDSALFAQKNIDPRLFIVVMAYQTDMDFWAYHARQSRKNDMTLTIDSLVPSQANEEKWVELRKNLECYDSILTRAEPSEEDFLYVENFVQEYLLGCTDLSFEEDSEPEMNQAIDEIALDAAILQENKVYEGMKKLIPLLGDHHFTENQKRALYIMIDAKLKQGGR